MKEFTLLPSTIREFLILVECDNIIVEGEALPRFPDKYKKMITGIEYDDRENKDAKLTIHFAGLNTEEDIEFLLNLEQKYLTVQWGYHDMLSPRYRVYVVDVTVNYALDITATLIAYNGGVNMDIVKRRIWHKVNTPSDMPYTYLRVSDIVKKIAEENGMNYVIDETNIIKDKTIKQTVSDSEFLKELLQYAKPADNTTRKYTLKIENNVIFFTCYDRYKAPEYIFRYRTEHNGVVISFSPKSNEKKGKRLQSKKASTVNKETKKTVSYGAMGDTIDVNKITDEALIVRKENEGSDFATKVINSKDNQYYKDKFIQTTDEKGNTVLIAAIQMNVGEKFKIQQKEGEEPKLVKAIVDSDLDKNKVDNENEAEKFEEMEATLTTLGIPTIGKGIVIAIQNVFGKYEGNWYISGLKHSLNDTSYTTTFNLKRNPELPDKKAGEKASESSKVSYGAMGDTIDVDKITGDEPVSGDPNNRGKYIWPLNMKGARISSPWNEKRLRKNGTYYRHDGVDIAKTGTVPIIASAPGTVIIAGNISRYGQTVFIKDDYGYYQTYAHLRTGLKVQKGQRVKQGQILGYMGSTGHSTAQHLHFEFRTSGILSGSVENDIDPIPFMPPRSK